MQKTRKSAKQKAETIGETYIREAGCSQPWQIIIAKSKFDLWSEFNRPESAAEHIWFAGFRVERRAANPAPVNRIRGKKLRAHIAKQYVYPKFCSA